MRRSSQPLPSPFASLVVVAGLLLPSETPADVSDPVLSAIEELESDHDATCHSSASRFEDFLYGTPLSSSARHAHVELQKRLVRRLWAGASALAVQSGDAVVRPDHLRRVQILVVAVDADGKGELRVEFPGGPALVVPERRATQYASVAYSLRAILAVQQDLLVTGGEPLLDLAPESIETLRQTLDVVALSVLEIADRDARERGEFEIREPRLRAAWDRLVPGLGEAASEASSEPPADVRARSLALLDRTVEGKLAAYRAYNELDDGDTTPLLVFNISRFYARRPLSPVRRERRHFVQVFEGRLDAWTVELLGEADRRARAARHPLIRADDATPAGPRPCPTSPSTGTGARI